MQTNQPVDVKTCLDPEAQKCWTAGKWKGQLIVAKFVAFLKELGRLATVQDVEQYIEASKKHSVVSYLDGDGQKAWLSGEWKGKVVVAKLMEFLEGLGRLATVGDVEAYIASAETSHLDTPLKKKELEEKFGGTKNLSDLPMTILGSKWLADQMFAGRPATQNRKVMEAMETRAWKEKEQLPLELVKALFQTVSGNLAKEEFGQDVIPGYKTGEMLPCEFGGCECKYSAMRRTVVKDGNVLVYGSDTPALEGCAIRTGSFRVVKGGDGKFVASSLCPEHRTMWLKTGEYCYCYEDAEKIASALNAEAKINADRAKRLSDDLALMQKQAAENPQMAEKQRNKDVRWTRDSGRQRPDKKRHHGGGR